MKTFVRSACLALVLGALGLVHPPSALAQTVYRCGSSYSQVPCDGARAIDAADVRSDSQRLQAEVGARDTVRAAAALEAERMGQEDAAARARQARERRESDARRKIEAREKAELAAKAKAAAKAGKKKKRGADPDYFTAAGPPAQK